MDASAYLAVLYRLDGKQTSTSFEDIAFVTRFQGLADKFGPTKALEIIGADPALQTMSVGQWLEHHIAHLTGLRKSTPYDYRSYGDKMVVTSCVIDEMPEGQWAQNGAICQLPDIVPLAGFEHLTSIATG